MSPGKARVLPDVSLQRPRRFTSAGRLGVVSSDIMIRSRAIDQTMSDIRNPERPARALEVPPAPRPGATAIAGGISLVLLAVLFAGYGFAQGVLYVVALGLGIALYHARFGFTSAFRQLMAVGQGQTLRAHMLMLAVASLLFAPLMALGTTAFGGPLSGYVFPVGLSVAFGGFIFCVGMQLGGACASGSLYTVGSGQTSILITLFGFIVGSVWGAHDFGFWTAARFRLAEDLAGRHALGLHRGGDPAVHHHRRDRGRNLAGRAPCEPATTQGAAERAGFQARAAWHLAALGRGPRSRRAQRTHAVALRQAVGHHQCVRALGIASAVGAWVWTSAAGITGPGRMPAVFIRRFSPTARA